MKFCRYKMQRDVYNFKVDLSILPQCYVQISIQKFSSYTQFYISILACCQSVAKTGNLVSYQWWCYVSISVIILLYKALDPKFNSLRTILGFYLNILSIYNCSNGFMSYFCHRMTTLGPWAH